MIAMGHVSKDVELRYTPTGKAVCQSSIALNRIWKNDAGDKMEQVTFLDWTAFGTTAETLSQHVKKGSLIHFTGYLKQDSWDDKQTGQKRTKILMIVEKFTFCGSRKEPDAADVPATGTAEQPKRRFAKPMSDEARAEVAATPKADDSDDVPF